MDEAEYCDRTAIMDNGEIVVRDSPEALKASVGADRVFRRNAARALFDPDYRAREQCSWGE